MVTKKFHIFAKEYGSFSQDCAIFIFLRNGNGKEQRREIPLKYP